MVAIQDVYIIGSGRSPIGSLNGTLSGLSATELGGQVVKGVLKKYNIPSEQVEQIIFGNVLSAGLGQNPARQVALKAGLSKEVISTSVNKVCASGLKAVAFGAQSIQLGEADLIVVGGVESMSNAPHYLMGVRKDGLKFGDKTLADGLFLDGLKDAYQGVAMGEYAELCAKEHQFDREASDNYAIESYKRALNAQSNGYFEKEIIPIEVKNPKRNQPNLIINKDEEPEKFDESKIRSIKPAFPSAGTTVTAPNASSLNDGAAALVLASKAWLDKAVANGWQPNGPIFKILSSADAECDPEHFTIAPSKAIPNALKKANLNINQVDQFEINEAFSVVALANLKRLELAGDKVNVFGGAVALGHPLGCSGARILVTLLNGLNLKDKKLGCAGICNGGGGASALIVEKINALDLGLVQPQSNL